MPKRVDENQGEIHERLIAEMGCSVESIASVGKGCPDSLVGFQGFNFVFEIKNPKQQPCKRKLRKEQLKWHAGWKGQVDKIETFEEAAEIIKKKVGGEKP